MALNTLEQGGSEDGTVSDTVGTKIYKVSEIDSFYIFQLFYTHFHKYKNIIL